MENAKKETFCLCVLEYVLEVIMNTFYDLSCAQLQMGLSGWTYTEVATLNNVRKENVQMGLFRNIFFKFPSRSNRYLIGVFAGSFQQIFLLDIDPNDPGT